MNNPNLNPFVPQGSLLEQKNRLRARVKTAFFCVVGVPAAAILVALLAQGCKREQPAPPLEQLTPPTMEFTNPPPPIDTNPPPVAPTNPPILLPMPVAPAGVTEYTIVRGDTFASIAKNHGISVKAIQSANPTVNPLKLQPNQKIVIPASTVAPAGVASAAVAPVVAPSGEQVYVVKSGDTLTKLGTRFGTTVKAIQAANNLTTTSIKVGQKLKIPAKASAPAPAPAETAPIAPPPVAPPPSAAPLPVR
jgi:LysM repeat protein